MYNVYKQIVGNRNYRRDVVASTGMISLEASLRWTVTIMDENSEFQTFPTVAESQDRERGSSPSAIINLLNYFFCI